MGRRIVWVKFNGSFVVGNRPVVIVFALESESSIVVGDGIFGREADSFFIVS